MRAASSPTSRRSVLVLEELENRNPPVYLLGMAQRTKMSLPAPASRCPPPDFTQIEARAVTASGSALTYETGIPSGVTATQRLAVASTDAQSAAQRETSVPSTSASNGLGEEPTAAGDLTQNPLDVFLAATASQPRGGGSAGFADAAGANQGAGFVAAASAGSTPAPGSISTPATIGSGSEQSSAGMIPPALSAAPATQSPAGLVPKLVPTSFPNSSLGTRGTTPAHGGPLDHDRSDPMWVLDANKAIVVTPGVTEHEFSNSSMSLMAQVSGGTVSSYSWNTSGASEAGGISGSNTYNLTFTWNSFTGSARTDTISVTETPTVGNPITQTLTFLVNSTSSQAYPPPSSPTWPSVLQPDALTPGQATAGLGPYYALGLTEGDVQIDQMMPSYNPDSLPLGLVYSSAAANPNPQPIFIVHYQLSPSQSVPSQVSAQLTLNSVQASTVYWNTSGLNPGDIMQLALQPSNTALATGRYSYSISVTANSTTTYSGNVDIINNSSSVFGAGWSLAGLEHIWSVSGGGGVILDEGGGLSLWFASTGGGNFTTPPGDTSTLTQNTSNPYTYTRTLKDGTQIQFSSSALLASGSQSKIVDTNNNTWTYNYNGNQLTSITDPYSLNVTFTYTSGLVTSITDPASRTATLTYCSGQLTSWKDPDNALWTYTYDSANHLTNLTNPRNYTTTFTYNSGGWVTSVSRPDSTSEQLTALQSQGFGGSSSPGATPVLAAQVQASYTDPRSNAWNYRLDWLGFGEPTQSVDPLGNMSLIYRDGNGLGWLTADPLAHRERYFFDSKFNPTIIVLADDNYGLYTYNNFSEPTKYTDPNGAVTTYTYDSHGNLTQLTDALSHVTTYSYDSHGFVTSITDPLSHTTNFGYDNRERMTTLTDALSHTATFAYDSASNLTSTTNELGYTTTYTYDAMGRKLTETLPISSTSSATWTYTYNAAGNLATVTDPLSNTTTYGYDALNRVTTMTDALSHTTTYSYNNDGLVSSITDPLSHTTTFTYDADNRPTNRTDALGHVVTYTYDNAGHLTSSTNELGYTITYTYDARGRLVTKVLPASSGTYPTITYTYDAASNLTAITDPDNNTTTYGYDALHRVTTMTDALNHSATYSYDNAGRLTAKTDRNGRQVTYSYDADNRRTGETWVSGSYTATYTYDAAGELTAQSDPNSSYAYTYDREGRLTSVDNSGTPGVPHVVLSYTYDAADNLTSVTDSLSSSGAISYGFDAVHRMTTLALSVSGSQKAQVTFSYDTADRMTGQTRSAPSGTNITTAFGYDNDNRITGITYTAGTTTLASFTYTYDNAGEVSSYTGPEGTITYSYDPQGELLTSSGSTISWGYDANGNRTSYTTGTDNRLTGDGTYSYTYDNEGNLGAKINKTTREQTTYSWDYQNRLTEVLDKSGMGHTLQDDKFTYDVDGRRIGKSTYSGSQTWTVYNGANAYADFNGSGSLTERYLYGQAVDQLFARYDGTNASWYLTDLLGSVRVITDKSANVLDQITYGSWGNIVSESSPGNGDRFKFTGREWDSEIGLYYYRARYYDPGIGRFINDDPAGFGAGDANLYRYGGNAPTIYVDPTGQSWSWNGAWAGAGSGAVVGAGGGALAGTFVFPGVGTGLGAVSGGLLGGTIGFFAGGFFAQDVAAAIWGPTATEWDVICGGLLLGVPSGIIGAFAGPPLAGALGLGGGGAGAGSVYGKTVIAGGSAGLGGLGASQGGQRPPLSSVPAPVGGNAASRLPNLQGMGRADAHIAIRNQGFQYHGTTSGGYVRYRHPDGSELWIRPNGEVMRLGPKPPGQPNRPRYDPSGNVGDHPQGEFLPPLPGN